MNATAEIIDRVLSLPFTDRSYLATKLIESLDQGDEISPEWKEEIDRRSREIDEGKVTMIPGEQVMTEVRERLKEMREYRAAESEAV